MCRGLKKVGKHWLRTCHKNDFMHWYVDFVFTTEHLYTSLSGFKIHPFFVTTSQDHKSLLEERISPPLFLASIPDLHSFFFVFLPVLSAVSNIFFVLSNVRVDKVRWFKDFLKPFYFHFLLLVMFWQMIYTNRCHLGSGST